MPALEEILSDPGYQALNPEERTGIRRAFYQQTAKDPGFRSLPPREQQTISRDILFPASEYPEQKREARPKLSIREAAKEGWENIKAPITETDALGLRRMLGVLQVAGSPLQPAANLVTSAGERVSDYLKDIPERTLTTHLPVPGGGLSTTRKAIHPADVAAGLTAGVGDYLTGVGAAKALGLASKPLARFLPTKKEQVTSLQGAREQRLSDVEKLATEAQAKTTEAQAGRLQQIPATRRAIQKRGTRNIAAAEQKLAAQQQRVGIEAAEAGAPIGPRRTDFEKRYRDLERAADQVPAQPVNLNTAAFKITREPGLPGVPTTPAERSAQGLSQTLTEGVAGQVEEEITNQVKRMLTAPEAKAVDYNAITKSVLGNATSSDVAIGELLRTRQRLRAAQRAAYDAEHKNLARQFGVMEDAITKDIAIADKRIAGMAARIDKDYFKKKAADWYAEGVDQAFDPAKGVWDRKRFTKWWEKHADSTNNDKDLRRLLGDRYKGTKGLIDDMQKATELNIEQAAKEAARNIKRRTGVELRDIAAREKQLGKLGEETGKQIQVARTQGKEAIEADIKNQIKQITGKPYAGSLHKVFGSLALVGGVGTTAAGIIAGSPTTIAAGLGTAGSGLFTIMTHDALLKFINTAHGASITRRLIRATPGTGEAIAASNAAARLWEGIKAQEGGEQEVTPTAPQETAARRATEQSKKEALMKKWGIQ